MGIASGAVRQHWNFFLALEEDIVRLSRFIEPAHANFNVYSLELSRILLSACSEVDIVCKIFCKKIVPTSRAKTIDAYCKTIVQSRPILTSAIVEIPKFALQLNPWEAWAHGRTPAWWRAHTNVKHERDRFFTEATLKHALNAASALFILLLFYYREEADQGQLQPNPTLFRAGAPFVVDRPFYGSGNLLYQLSTGPGVATESLAAGAVL